MLQGMTRIARWLARGSDSEGVVERAIRRSFIGKWKELLSLPNLLFCIKECTPYL